MSDSAFKTAAFPGYTAAELEKIYAEKSSIVGYGDLCEKIQAELDRRYAVAAGDKSKMTAGERLRYARNT